MFLPKSVLPWVLLTVVLASSGVKVLFVELSGLAAYDPYKAAYPVNRKGGNASRLTQVGKSPFLHFAHSWADSTMSASSWSAEGIHS